MSSGSERYPSAFAGASRGRRAWLAAVICVATVPFLQGFTNSSVFYIRDLSSYFWPRFLWLRHAWLSGEWPLWDPYIAGGQAAYSDALHQMFFPPAVLARLLPGEALSFNLWIALPFPMAAIGAWLFFQRRFSPQAASFGAVAFAVCGPIVSTGNFPNFSWAVAALPWVMWAADDVVAAPGGRTVAWLAVTIAMQALAGEPVTLFSTILLAAAYALAMAAAESKSRGEMMGRAGAVGAGVALGIALAAIQVVPMVAAAQQAGRSDAIIPDLWSLRPTALFEAVWLHLFGDYFVTQTLNDVPWMPLVYTGREPLLFSIYFGVPLLSLAIFGLGGDGPRPWRLFWLGAGLIGVLAAFGSYTPVYPILRDHVPPFGSFRFPVKYFTIAALAVAASAAAGWDALMTHRDPAIRPAGRRAARARLVAVAFALAVACGAGLFAAACLFMPARVAGPLNAYSRALGAEADTAAAFLIRTVPGAAVPIVVVAVATALLLGVITSARLTRLTTPLLYALAALTIGDLLVRAAGINPVLDVKYFAKPSWLTHTRADPDARIYVGGKTGMSLLTLDVDAPRGYQNAPGLTGSASRAALNTEAVFYPSAWHVREILSYDLPVIWPKSVSGLIKRFFERDTEERERVLRRTGVRYRVLPQRRAGARQPLAALPQFFGSFLFDFGDEAAPRLSIVPAARLVPDTTTQVRALFEPDWNSADVVLVDRELSAIGERSAAAAESKTRPTFVEDWANRSVIDASVGPGGGYLVVLDTYSDDWTVTVDGQPSVLARANGLFRAVRLPEGRHRVAFDYRPRMLRWGIAITTIAFVVVLALFVTRPGEAPSSGPAWMHAGPASTRH